MDFEIEETLGTPLQIIPVLQSLQRDKSTMTSISLERWDQYLLINLEFVEEGWRSSPTASTTPSFSINARDGNGIDYAGRSRGGGSGGGLFGLTSRWMFQISPIPPAHAELEFIAHVHYREHLHNPPQENGWIGFGGEPADREWSDPIPWIFAFTMPDHLDQNRYIEREPQSFPPVQNQHAVAYPDSGNQLLKVVPVMQSTDRPGETLTFLAIEHGVKRFRIIFSVRSKDRVTYDHETRCAVQDDLGTRYSVWPSSGGGTHRDAGTDIHFSYEVVPAIDPDARKLYIALEDPLLNRIRFQPPLRNPAFRNPLKMGDWIPELCTFVVEL